MKLYIVKYCANECGDLGYDSPYPIYYSLNRYNAYGYFSSSYKLWKVCLPVLGGHIFY